MSNFWDGSGHIYDVLSQPNRPDLWNWIVLWLTVHWHLPSSSASTSPSLPSKRLWALVCMYPFLPYANPALLLRLGFTGEPQQQQRPTSWPARQWHQALLPATCCVRILMTSCETRICLSLVFMEMLIWGVWWGRYESQPLVSCLPAKYASHKSSFLIAFPNLQ